jgi:hypothetical protein
MGAPRSKHPDLLKADSDEREAAVFMVVRCLSQSGKGLGGVAWTPWDSPRFFHVRATDAAEFRRACVLS